MKGPGGRVPAPSYHRLVVTAVAECQWGERAPYMHATRSSTPEELPPYGGNLQLGCGLVVRRIKGRLYLYFWAYEEHSWGAHRAWKYVSPIGKSATRARARELLITYHVKVKREIDRRMSALVRTASGS